MDNCGFYIIVAIIVVCLIVLFLNKREEKFVSCNVVANGDQQTAKYFAEIGVCNNDFYYPPPKTDFRMKADL